MDLNEWIDQTSLVVCVGSGGVGKTTCAASIGLWAALRGRRVMVLTIDPAKRLANSLGLSSFGNTEKRIDLGDEFPAAKGELWAMMLDSKSTWDDLISRVSPNEEVRDRIRKNHVFRAMADTFAGSQEYMATEKLYDVAQSGRYDLIILDTPPVKNALDFLESPGRVVQFLDEKVLGWFLNPYNRASLFGSLMQGTSAVFFKLMGTIFGADFLDDLTELMHDLKELYAGFRHRHDQVLTLFKSDKTGFLTICAPTQSSIEVAEFFQDELSKRSLPRAGVIVNQVHLCKENLSDVSVTLKPYFDQLSVSAELTQRVGARLVSSHRRLLALSESEKALINTLQFHATGGGFFRQVPRLNQDVHDLKALHAVGVRIFKTPADVL